MSEDKSAGLDRLYWTDIAEHGPLAGITLDPTISPEDFYVYGNRLAARQLGFLRRFADRDFSRQTVLDVGCGVGRICLPFSTVFRRVIGTDINAAILDEARRYLVNAPNVTLVQGDGLTLPVEDASVDVVYSGGVLQHIPDLEVICGYFREGLRVLRSGGSLIYTFQTWYTERAGGTHGNRVGAQVLASDITATLADQPARVLGMVSDSLDPIPHLTLVLEKAAGPVKPKEQRLRERDVVDLPLRTGIFEDLDSYAKLRALWAKGRDREVTFWK
jgi:SAM-dependent methyltransferase